MFLGGLYIGTLETDPARRTAGGFSSRREATCDARAPGRFSTSGGRRRFSSPWSRSSRRRRRDGRSALGRRRHRRPVLGVPHPARRRPLRRAIRAAPAAVRAAPHHRRAVPALSRRGPRAGDRRAALRHDDPACPSASPRRSRCRRIGQFSAPCPESCDTQ